MAFSFDKPKTPVVPTVEQAAAKLLKKQEETILLLNRQIAATTAEVKAMGPPDKANQSRLCALLQSLRTQKQQLDETEKKKLQVHSIILQLRVQDTHREEQAFLHAVAVSQRDRAATVDPVATGLIQRSIDQTSAKLGSVANGLADGLDSLGSRDGEPARGTDEMTDEMRELYMTITAPTLVSARTTPLAIPISSQAPEATPEWMRRLAENAPKN